MRRALKVLKWVLLVLLLPVVAWVAFNGPWADAPARPRPPLLLQAPLTPGQPSAFALLRDKSLQNDEPDKAPWQCGQKSPIDCTPVWLAQGPALREQLKSIGPLADVCETASAEGVSWTEPELKLPKTNPAAVEIPQFKNITRCLRWLRAQATLAVLDGDDARAMQYLRRADQAVRGSLGGAQTLIGHAVAWSMSLAQWQNVAALARVRPQLARPLLELLRPLDPSALSTARWISFESGVYQAIQRDMHSSCDAIRVGAGEYRDWLDHLWCQGRLGLLPELTAQEMDAYFLQVAEQSRDGAVNAAVNGMNASDPEPSPWAWRNTVGHVLAVVARPHWASYVKRQADVELLRQAAVLVVELTIDPVPAERRQAWFNAQKLRPEIKSRLSMTDAGLLEVRLLREDSDKAEPLRLALSDATRKH
ncbi:hypothetical protein ACFJGW_07080 [Burkholderiaceae bacterium UC74_6]